jgi:hypothetical protein
MIDQTIQWMVEDLDSVKLILTDAPLSGESFEEAEGCENVSDIEISMLKQTDEDEAWLLYRYYKQLPMGLDLFDFIAPLVEKEISEIQEVIQAEGRASQRWDFDYEDSDVYRAVQRATQLEEDRRRRDKDLQ